MVKDEGLLALLDELLVEDVEHLKERGVVGDVLHLMCVEMTLILRTILLPIFDGERNVFHNF